MKAPTKWARSLGVGALLATLVGSPALARRSPEPPAGEGRGCSLDDWRVVVETDKGRLCLFARDREA